jgi:hypothetical protein
MATKAEREADWARLKSTAQAHGFGPVTLAIYGVFLASLWDIADAIRHQ